MKNSLIMGVLNITPDSFSDGGKHFNLDKAIKSAKRMVKQGANIIDIGGESTRPGAPNVSLKQELSRVIPVIKALNSQIDTTLSIDTSKPEIMVQAVDAGAGLINDVNALQAHGVLQIAASLGADVCLVHRQGNTQTMQNNPTYTDVVAEIKSFFDKRINACIDAGINSNKIMLDPGFGFGKTLAHNLEILRRFGEFKSFSLPLVAGISRKSMIGTILDDRNVDNRLVGSVTAAIIAIQNGANIVRVHDVLATKDALRVLQCVTKNNKE